jgi:hypothetical protein
MSATLTAIQSAQTSSEAANPQSLKQGLSKFDAALADNAQNSLASGSGSNQAFTSSNDFGASDQARFGQSVEATDKTGSPEVQLDPPVSTVGSTQSGTTPSMLVQLMGDLESGGGALDKLIKQGLNQQLSNSELLSLQASMYKYTQELDLTGKVVQEATSSLKDTLKTQV